MSSNQHESLSQALIAFHKKYDPVAKLIRVPYTSYSFLNIFQGLPVHPTRCSIEYAIALLEVGDNSLIQRAREILKVVLKLQIRNSKSKHYGIWPKYLEEKPFKVLRPDKNWTEFIAVQLLQISLMHRDHIPPMLMSDVDLAIIHAAHAIKQRNVSVKYTNVAVMGVYVTLITGQTYDNIELYDYGIERLQDFHKATFSQNSFSEYNSPTYEVITLEALGRLRLCIHNVTAKKLVEDLYRLAWKTISSYFHPQTRQWAGPHSRSYSTLLKSSILSFIAYFTSDKVNISDSTCLLPSLAHYCLPLSCPPDIEKYFLSKQQPFSIENKLSNNKPGETLTTYMHPKFTLGTVSYSDFWHQRRPIILYYGDVAHPHYLRLRVLHNGIDCAAAQFFSIQEMGNMLGGISFAQDIHSSNPYINRDKGQNISFQAQDLRLRFEFNEVLESTHFQLLNSPILLMQAQIKGLYFQISVPYAQFDSESIRWETRQDGNKSWFDLVIISCRNKKIDLSNVQKAALGLTLQINVEKTTLINALVSEHTDHVEIEWNGMFLAFVTSPSSKSFLVNTFVKGKCPFV